MQRRHIIYSALLVLLCVAAFVLTATADQHYWVDGNSGSDSTGNGTEGNPWKTIKNALDHSNGSFGDASTIHVAPATYSSTTNGESFPITVESFTTLLGEDRDTTVLDARNAEYHVIDCHEISNVVIENLTVTRGNADGFVGAEEEGGGIYCRDVNGVFLNNNTIEDNSADGEGGGIYFENCLGILVQSCKIQGNTAETGGGLYSNSASGNIHDCTFQLNYALEGGGLNWTSGSPTIEHNTISENRAYNAGGGLSIYYGSSSCNIRYNTFEINTVSTHPGGAAIYCFYGSPAIQGNTITGNTSYDNGGGIACDNECHAIISDDNAITGNHAGGRGGGIHCDDYDASNIVGNTIEGNEAVEGGGIHCTFHSYSTIQDNVISGNTVTDNGGGICCRFHAHPVIEDSTIAGNNAANGAGLYCIIDSNPTVRRCFIGLEGSPNTATYYGGGVHCDASLPVIEDCYVEHNEAGYGGGGFRFYNESSPTLTGTSISNNKLTNGSYFCGAGIYSAGECNPELTDCVIDNNTGAAYGGGIYMSGQGCELAISNTTLSNNTATRTDTSRLGGAVYCEDYGSLSLQGCAIDGNEARYGGGMYITESSTLIIENSTVSNNAGVHGAGVFTRTDSLMEMRFCEVTSNQAGRCGAGVRAQQTASGTKIEHCIITDNIGNQEQLDNYGGVGVSVVGCSPSIFNCLIARNQLHNAVGIGGGVLCQQDASPTITDCTIAESTGEGLYVDTDGGAPTLLDCILWGNDDDLVNVECSQVSYCDVEDGDCSGSSGNFSEDPLFCHPSAPEYYEYHYLSQTTTGHAIDSPCVDAGDTTSYDRGLHVGATRRDGYFDAGTLDIGYHYTSGTQVYFVDAQNGDDDWDGQAPSYQEGETGPFKTITHAISESAPDEDDAVAIMVAAGEYDLDMGSGDHETFPIEPKSFTALIGAGRADATIDAGGSGQEVILISSKEWVTVKGFKLTGGDNNTGGGVSCTQSDYLDIDLCHITANTSTQFGGGGVYLYDCGVNASIRNCDIEGNTSTSAGAGICCTQNTSPLVFNCLVRENTSSASGGGIYLSSSSDAEILNCTLEGNAPSGVTASSSFPILTNCILWNNGDELEGVSCDNVTYCDIQGGDCSENETNMSEDPKFVPRDPDNEDQYIGYYIAQVEAQGGDSPCLNKGDDQASSYGLDAYTTCTDGRHDEGVVDIGYHHPKAYEGDGYVCIRLDCFIAQPAGSRVALTWTTGAEIDNAGFLIYRTEGGTRDYTLVSGLIPAKGGPSFGASYGFTDREVSPGKAYKYWLMDIDESGKWTLHGPAATRLPELKTISPEETMAVSAWAPRTGARPKTKRQAS